MTREENIRAILECNFAGFKDEIIDTAVKRICELDKESILDKIRVEIENLSTHEYMTDGVTCYGKRQLTAEEFKGQLLEIIDKYTGEIT